MTIILPEGTVNAWQAAHHAANIGQWNDLATDLMHCAAEERDYPARDDILTLALIACQHAFDLLPGLELNEPTSGEAAQEMAC